MKLQLSQGTYMRLLGLLFLIIAFGSCFSLGYVWNGLNPGDKAVKLSFVLMYFMGFWFFYNMGNQMISTEVKMPTDEEADKIIKEFETSQRKSRKKQKKSGLMFNLMSRN